MAQLVVAAVGADSVTKQMSFNQMMISRYMLSHSDSSVSTI